MYNTGLIRKAFEEQMHIEAYSIQQFEDVPNNKVFRVETAAKSYIFKIYAKRDWPENGKLAFVSRKLGEHKIPHAELFVFNRDDDNFPYGYLIEECLPGATADRLVLSRDETLKLFEKLALLVSRVHRIELTGYGYTGSGIGTYTAFSEFMYDVLKDDAPSLTANGLIEIREFEDINKAICERIKCCDMLPPVLCHGDLSTKNILVDSNEITLIDWDDAHSLCWMADIARMTLWMKITYDSDTADACRKVFLGHYETAHNQNAFMEIEDTLHVWYGLDNLSYYARTLMEEKVKALLRDSRRKCGI
jgi:aminoglycoside phosphotransferase (APT) family kinase protein